MAQVALRKEGLAKYIEVVYQMEQMKFKQGEAIKNVESEINRLEGMYVGERPEMPTLKKENAVGLFAAGAGLIVLDFAGIIPGVFLKIVAFFVAVSWLAIAFEDHGKNKESTKAYKRRMEWYERELVNYNKRLEMSKTKKMMASVLKKQVTEMKKALNKMEQDLVQAYSCDVIYPAYRNLVAVSSFYDYLFSNRCTTLEGHEGAYNMFNMEARLDKIITRLDRICSQLEQIKYCQNALYNAMKDSNQKMEGIQSSLSDATRMIETMSDNQKITNATLQKLECNTRLNEFNTDQIRREVELRNRMEGIYSYGWMN